MDLQARFKEGLALHQRGRLADAERIYRKILQKKPDHFDALHLLGVISVQTQQAERGVELIRKAIGVNPNIAAAHSHLANALTFLRRPAEALASYDRAIALKPDYADAYNNRGRALEDLRRPDEALASYDKAIALAPDFAEAHINRAGVLQDLKRLVDALASCDKAIALNANFAEAHNNRGSVLQDMNRPADALASFTRAIALKAGYAEAYTNLGAALRELRRPEDALASYDKAIACAPDFVAAWVGRGNVLSDMTRHGEAADAYARVLKIEPDYPFAKGAYLIHILSCCDWSGLDELILQLDADIAAGRPSVDPFEWQAVSGSEASLRLCAELYNAKKFPAHDEAAYRPRPANGKIRVGYLSGEFRQQATSMLLAGVYERHDEARFEIFAFDNGWDDQSGIRKRIDAAFHGIIDISRLDDASAADAICDRQIDILVNLNGYFGKERTQLFARRLAPIQVNYLGFPGTLGAKYFDYIVADRQVIPQAHEKFYTEKIVRLPNCYQPNDRKRAIGTRAFGRAEFGLPENGFVFCCFNNNYKLQPAMFDCWMRILARAEASVLWLYESNAAVADNLRKEAAARGLGADRLVFAKYMPVPEHLARHRLADLFLDTLPCNAHTTASDALWTGLPVLTCRGETFPGRVGASVLNAIGLRELIAANLDDYERMAVELATQPEKIANVKRMLSDNLLTTPLFDTALYTRHLEAAFIAMHDRYRAGLPPDHLAVAN